MTDLKAHAVVMPEKIHRPVFGDAHPGEQAQSPRLDFILHPSTFILSRRGGPS
jgi:hypothetical protein